jgi:hypothetical protein
MPRGDYAAYQEFWAKEDSDFAALTAETNVQCLALSDNPPLVKDCIDALAQMSTTPAKLASPVDGSRINNVVVSLLFCSLYSP